VTAAGPTYFFGAITVDDVNIYWGATGQLYGQGVVMQMPRAGGDVLTLAHGGAPQAGALVSDGARLYWTTVESGILSVPIGGGEVTTLVTGGSSRCIAVDEENAYWTDSGGAVFKVAKTGGAPVALYKSTPIPLAITLDDASVYWSAGNGVFRESKDGGTAVTLMQGEPDPACRSLPRVGDTLFAAIEQPSDAGFFFVADILAVPTGGAASTTVLASATLVSLVASSTHLFWFGYRPPISIDETAQDGGGTGMIVTPLAPSLNDIVVASDGTLYWTTDFQILALKP